MLYGQDLSVDDRKSFSTVRMLNLERQAIWTHLVSVSHLRVAIELTLTLCAGDYYYAPSGSSFEK